VGAIAVFTGANHLCVVTGDLDRAIRAWADRYGVGPWSVWTKDPSNMTATVEGRLADFAIRVALCSLSPTFRLELIQPLDDRSPYAASLARHGGADHVHHLRLDVDDYGDARDRLVGLGNDVLLDAGFDGAPGIDDTVRATYFGTEDELGLTLEIADVPSGFVMPEPERVHPTPQEVRP
jgi:methylmalonyl-CoA/ethylmalonyl-CoA epimerase